MSDIKQEKLDDMRRDMMIEMMLRKDSDYFNDHLSNIFCADLERLFCKIENECKLYGYDNVTNLEKLEIILGE